MTKEIQTEVWSTYLEELENTKSAINSLLMSLDLNTDIPYGVLENIKTIQKELKIIEIKTTPFDKLHDKNMKKWKIATDEGHN
jgi:hypothetical protein